MNVQRRWWSSQARENVLALEERYGDVLDALAEYDALGHRHLARLSQDHPVTTDDEFVANALLRRAVTLFAGIRRLVEGALVEPAKLLVRAHFELTLQFRYLLYGDEEATHGPSPPDDRVVRARYFRAASLRGDIYRRQQMLDGRLGDYHLEEESQERLRKKIVELRTQLEEHYPTQQEQMGAFGFERVGPYHDRRKWYSFEFKGNPPNSVRQLAKRLGWLDVYEQLYPPLTALMHPTGTRQDQHVEGSHVEILPPHLVEAFPLLMWWTVRFHQMSLMWFTQAYQPGSTSDVQDVWRKHEPALRELRPYMNGLPLGWL